MCASCGCGKLDDDHGDDRHLTMKDLEDAAKAAGISVAEVVQNLEDSAEMGGDREGVHASQREGRS